MRVSKTVLGRIKRWLIAKRDTYRAGAKYLATKARYRAELDEVREWALRLDDGVVEVPDCVARPVPEFKCPSYIEEVVNHDDLPAEIHYWLTERYMDYMEERRAGRLLVDCIC